jgi:tetratricopeptide (TPR) repeat protein
MTDGTFPNRMAQLKARWESDPTSRIFLQLAEEYRHQGRIKEALAVLDRGLQEHPGYLSALVAKGRCHLELGEGEAARSVLERVVKQDATQMVANKLLVRAYLDTGELERARERLDLYSLLNDSDPEIGDLRRQIKLMDHAKEQAFEDSHPSSHQDDVFDLGGNVAIRREAEDVFQFSEPGAVEAQADEAEEEDGDLFPGLISRASRERYLTGLAAEGIFEVGITPIAPSEVPLPAAPPAAFALPPIAPPAAIPEEPPLPAEPEPFPLTQFEPPLAAAEPAIEDESWLEELPPVPQVPEPPAPQPFTSHAWPEAGLEEPAELWPEEEEEEAEQAGGQAATATLGELYLRQGHVDEAERMFREVLDREPGNAAARAGLGRLQELQPAVPAGVGATLHARDLLAGFRSGSGGGTTARKAFLLTRYLDRLRGSRNVP